MNDKPCKKCGHCPSCGRGGYTVSPWYQKYNYPQPIWTGPYPNYPYGTYGGASRGNVSIQISSSKTYC